jgi:hypothetical protein
VRCHGGQRESGEVLAGSHQWCVDAGQSLVVVGWLWAFRFVGDVGGGVAYRMR